MVGVVSLVVSIVAIATRCTGADMTVSLLAWQLTALKAALDHTHDWTVTSPETVPQHDQHLIDLGTSLNSYRFSVIHSHFFSLQ